ncbi:MAG: hypothetical protein ACRBCK_02880 [Alphaproteobacteria bacterium]
MNVKFDPQLLCPLCGKRTVQVCKKKYISKEHIPPKSVLRNCKEHIKVPACKECNQGTSSADEQFKYLLAMYLGVDEKSFGLWNSAIRTLNRKKDVRAKIITNTSNILVPHHKGGYGYQVDIGNVDKHHLKKFIQVCKKIVRGLHWYITYEVLPCDTEVIVKVLDQGDAVPDEWNEVLHKFGREIYKAEGNFIVRYAIVEDQENASLWVIRFYGQDLFWSIVKPTTEKFI